MQDIRLDNILLAQKRDVEYHKNIELGKVYIIDFGESRQYRLGPGEQPAEQIHLHHRYLPPGGGRPVIDPYSWDIYCLGRSLGPMMQVRQ